MSSESGSNATRWLGCADDNVVWLDFAPDFVAYHRPSGRTHFLNESSKALLTEILAEPKDLNTILAVFSPAVADSMVDTYVEHMQAMLEHLEGLGLIERA